MLKNEVIHMVRDWLILHDYDGLYRDGECACHRDDLEPCCDGMQSDCRAGTQKPCDCKEDRHEWHIGASPHGVVEEGGSLCPQC